MFRLRRIEIILFVLAVAVRLIFHYATRFIADDAFITFRYAQNLAAGHGFVYNLGERVLGTTTPFFTFVLAALALLKIEPPTGALAVSVICSGAIAVIIYRLATKLRFTYWATLPALCYIVWPRSVVADSSGMETALFTLLVTAAFYFQYRRLTIYAVGMATLAAVTRPEGLGLLGLLLIVDLVRNRSQYWKYLLTSGMILVPWVLVATYYFGSPIPNSITAKMTIYSRFGEMSVWERFISVMGWQTVIGILLLPAVIAGARWLWRKQDYGRLELIWLAGMVLFYTLGPSKLFFWYIAPIYPLFLLFAIAAIVYAFDRVKWLHARTRTGVWILSAMIVVILVAACLKPYRSLLNTQQTQEAVHKSIGLYLAGAAGRDDVVAAEDIGYMGYYSQLRIIDRDGLISPQVVPFNRTGDYGQVIRQFSPNWVVVCRTSPLSKFVDEDWFTTAYAQVAKYSREETDYRVYHRIVPR